MFLFIIGMFRRNPYEIQVNTKSVTGSESTVQAEQLSRNPYEIQVNTKPTFNTVRIEL